MPYPSSSDSGPKHMSRQHQADIHTCATRANSRPTTGTADHPAAPCAPEGLCQHSAEDNEVMIPQVRRQLVGPAQAQQQVGGHKVQVEGTAVQQLAAQHGARQAALPARAACSGHIWGARAGAISHSRCVQATSDRMAADSAGHMWQAAASQLARPAPSSPSIRSVPPCAMARQLSHVPAAPPHSHTGSLTHPFG